MSAPGPRPGSGLSTQNAALLREHTTVIEEPQSKATPSQAVTLLINAAVGAGVLSLPYAFMCAGWVGGALILAIVAIVESYTLYILSRWAERTRAGSYGELVHRALGPAAAIMLYVVVFTMTWPTGSTSLPVSLATGAGTKTQHLSTFSWCSRNNSIRQ